MGKLVFLYTFAADCICGEAATEETSVSEVRLHPSTPVTQRFFQGSFIYAVFKVQVLADLSADGDEEIRTLDPLLARQVLSQLSYIPVGFLLFFCLYGSGLK